MSTTRARYVFFAALACSGVAHGEPLHTGELVTPGHDREPTHIGGSGTVFDLYLRTDGNDGESRRVAIATCLGGLASVPDAGIELYLEPADRGSAALANVLADLGDEVARRALLGAIAERGLPPWGDVIGLLRMVRALGLSTHMPLISPSSGTRSLSRFFLQTGTAGRPYMRRPPSAQTAARSTCSFGGRTLDDDAIERLTRTDVVMHGNTVPSIDGSTGSVLARRVVTLHLDGRHLDVLRAALTQVRPLLESGRLRLRIEAGELGPKESTLLLRAMRLLDGDARVRLLDALYGTRVSLSPATEAWLLQAAGISPEEVLAQLDAVPMGPADTSSPAIAIDGVAANAYELTRLWRVPSLRARLAAPARILVAPPRQAD